MIRTEFLVDFGTKENTSMNTNFLEIQYFWNPD